MSLEIAESTAVEEIPPLREATLPSLPSISKLVNEKRGLLSQTLEHLGHDDALLDACAVLVSAIRSGGKVLLAGNGGSAAEAQHFAAELMGRYKRERPPLSAIALTTDTSILTAIGNDYGYEEIFSRQIAGLGRAGDVFVAFSASGESENVVRGANTAQELGLHVIAITGREDSSLSKSSTLAIRARSADTATIQETHLAITHILCDVIESALTEEAVQ